MKIGEKNCMNTSNVALITGASSGMGKALAIMIAKTGAKVIMLCRNEKRGEEALAEARALSGSNSIELMLCDLGNLSQVRQFCQDFKARFGRLNILINNAGVIVSGRHLTNEGYELQFGVNHLGHFLITNLLLDVIKNSAPSRIINVSSGAHKIGKIHFDDINLEKNYTLWRAYSQSKLANILFTYELDRQLEGTGVTVNCLHPGAVATNMGIDRDTGFGKLITGILRPFFKTPEQGADTAFYLAVSNEVEGISGKYYYRRRITRSSSSSYDIETGKKLWELSKKMTGQ